MTKKLTFAAAFILLGGFFMVNTAKAAPTVIINEFVSHPASGNEWVELLNLTGAPISLDGWKLSDLTNPNNSPAEVEMVALSGTIPANGILVFDIGATPKLNDGGDSIALYSGAINPANLIQRVTYGTVDSNYPVTVGLETAPATGQSATYINPSWSISNTPTMGWFNNAGAEGQAPLLSTIDSALLAAGIETNMGELTNPSATPATEGAGALYFQKTGQGKIVFEKVLNLSDQATVAVLQGLGTAMEMSGGHIKFDSATAAAMTATGAKIYMYGMTLPNGTTPNILVDGVPAGGSDVESISYNSGTLAFTAKHFTEFDVLTDVYVRTDGDDTVCRGGTDAAKGGLTGTNQPCAVKTITKGISQVSIGGTVHVGAGTYVESVTVNKDVSIIGAGISTIVDPAVDSNGFIITAAGATIQNLKITLETSGVDAQAIKITSSNNVTISGNTIETTGDKGVGIWIGGTGYSNSNNLTITGNTITINSASTGIYAEGGSTAQTGWMIGGSVQNGNTITANNGNPLELYDVTNSTVDHNTLTTTASGGANVIWDSELASISNLIFTNNTLDGSNGSQVVIGTDFKDAPLDPGNVFTGSIATVTISSNSFSNWGSRALRLGAVAGAGTVTGIGINTNTFNMTVDTEVIGGPATDKTGTGNTFNVNLPAKIQKAVTSALSGDTINVAAGTYHESQIEVWLNKGFTLQGAGADVTTIDGDNAAAVNLGNGVHPGTIYIKNPDTSIKIDGFTFINPVTTSSEITFIAIAFGAGAPTPALMTISNNHFIGVSTDSNNLYDNAIWVYAAPAGVVSHIEDNEFENQWQSILLELPKGGAVITGNDFHNLFPSGGNPSQAMSLWQYGGTNVTAPVTISTNTFSASDGWSIVLRGGGSGNAQFVNNVTIEDNIITGEGSNSAGIVLRNPATTLSDAALDGILGATISGNTITSGVVGQGKGIWLRGENNNATITTNKISGYANGILSERYTADVDAGISTGVAATANWWGSADSATIKTKLSGAVSYRPWYLTNALTGLDSTAPTFSSILPSNSGVFGPNSNITYTLSENVASGSIKFTSGGTQTYNLSGTQLNSGAHSLLVSSLSNITLVNATNYDLAFDAEDASGNQATTVTKTGVTHDTSAPTVITKLGNNSADVTMAATTTVDVVFSEALDSASRTAVQEALTAGADQTITYGWNGANDTITITGHATNLTTFANDVVVNVSDVAGNTGTGLLIVDSILAATQTAPDGSGDATVDSTTPEVVITNPTQPVDVTISSDTTDPTIDVSAFVTDGAGNIPQITITSTTGTGNAAAATIEIPATTVTSASTSWDGVIAAPTVTTVTLPPVSGETKTLSTAIELGFANVKLSFANAVRILLPNQAGKRAGYIRTGIAFTEITTACGEDSQTWADTNLGADGECKIDAANGLDLVIWTKHFTSFATYTQTTNPVTGGYTGGVASYNWPAPASGPAPAPATSPAPTLPEGQVLGEAITRGNPANLTNNGLKEGDMVFAGGSSDPDVYIVNQFGYKRLFLNPIIFNMYGHLKAGWSKVKNIISSARDSFPTSMLFRNCETNDLKVYAVETTSEDTATLHWVNLAGDQAVVQDAEFFKKVFCINSNEFNWYSKSSVNYTALSQVPVYKR